MTKAGIIVILWFYCVYSYIMQVCLDYSLQLTCSVLFCSYSDITNKIIRWKRILSPCTACKSAPTFKMGCNKYSDYTSLCEEGNTLISEAEECQTWMKFGSELCSDFRFLKLTLKSANGKLGDTNEWRRQLTCKIIITKWHFA